MGLYLLKASVIASIPPNTVTPALDGISVCLPTHHTQEFCTVYTLMQLAPWGCDILRRHCSRSDISPSSQHSFLSADISSQGVQQIEKLLQHLIFCSQHQIKSNSIKVRNMPGRRSKCRHRRPVISIATLHTYFQPI